MADIERTGEKNSEAGQRTDGDAVRRKLDVLHIGEIRDRLIPYAEAKRYLTDEDFFRDIS